MSTTPHPSTPLPKTAPLLLMLASLLGSLACAGPAEPPPSLPPPPEPTTANLEPAVAAALAEARQAVLADPQRASAWGRFGETLQAHDLRPEAADCYSVAHRLAPAEVRWPYLEARALQPLDLDAALAAYARAAELASGDAVVHLAFGDALLESGDTTAALWEYDRALSSHDNRGNDAFVHFGRARALLLEGSLDAARQAAEEAVVLEPGLRNAHTLLAQIAQRQQDETSAQLHQWRAASLESSPAPNDPYYQRMIDRGVSAVWYRRRGLAALRAGRFAEAETTLRQVLAIQGDSAADHAHLGAALARQGRLDEARQLYLRGLELDPRSPTLHNNLAQALIEAGELTSAAEHLATALDIDPNDLEARLNSGLLAGRQGRLGEAREHFEKALDLAPGDVRVLGQLAPTLATLGQMPRAIELWQRMLTLAPERLEALEQLTHGLVSVGDHGQAITWLRRGLTQAPNSSRLSLMLAWELATAPEPTLRDGDEAIRLAQRVRQAYPTMVQAADVLAAAQAERGDFETAREQIEAAITLARQQGLPTVDLETRRSIYQSGDAFHAPALRPTEGS